MSVPQPSIALRSVSGHTFEIYQKNETYVKPAVHEGGCVKVVVRAYWL